MGLFVNPRKFFNPTFSSNRRTVVLPLSQTPPSLLKPNCLQPSAGLSSHLRPSSCRRRRLHQQAVATRHQQSSPPAGRGQQPRRGHQQPSPPLPSCLHQSPPTKERAPEVVATSSQSSPPVATNQGEGTSSRRHLFPVATKAPKFRESTMASETSVMMVIRASRPSFRNDYDKLAFSVHAAFLASDYALVATGKSAISNQIASFAGEEETGIEGWNEFEDSYSFVYLKKEKDGKKKVMVKCLAIENVLIVDVANLGDDSTEPCHLQLKLKDYLAEGNTSTGNYVDMYKNFASLVDSFKTEILEKLSPPSTKVESSSFAARHGGSAQDPTALSACVPECQPYGTGIVYPPVIPSGFSDVHPGAGAGVYPRRGSGDSGSMLLGPNDPRWFGGFEGERPDVPGGFGGIPGVPPGARFDPYGPPGVPGFEPTRFVRQPPRRLGERRGTHPDLEHFHDADYI